MQYHLGTQLHNNLLITKTADLNDNVIRAGLLVSHCPYIIAKLHTPTLINLLGGTVLPGFLFQKRYVSSTAC